MSTSEAGIDLAVDDLVETRPDVDAFLPGLGSEEHGQASPLELAVEATLREYAAAQLLKPRDAGKVALALDLTRVMAIKRRTGRTSTYSNDARLLYELLDSFVAEETAGDAAVTEAMQQWSALLAGMSLGRQPAA
jgi:hypothetical protein